MVDQGQPVECLVATSGWIELRNYELYQQAVEAILGQ
jgi:hypothetical protein